MPNIQIPTSRKREFFDLVFEWHKMNGNNPAAMPTEGGMLGDRLPMYGVPEPLMQFLKERRFPFETS